MNTTFIKYIIAINEEGNVSRAARTLFISQPALLKTLNNLENTYQTKLFIREKKNMILTEAGKSFIKNGKQILKLEQTLCNELHALSECGSGIINLGIPGERGAILLPIIMPQFQHLHPNYRLNIIEAYSANLETKLLDGTIDLALHTLPLINNLLKYEKLCDDFILIGASKDSSFAKRFDLKSNSIHHPYLIKKADLQDSEFLLVKKGRGMRRIADYLFEKHDINPHIYQEYDRHQTLVKMCSVGEQLCITPAVTPINLGIESTMCFFTLDTPVINRCVIVSCLKNKILSPIEQQLIKIAQDASQSSYSNVPLVQAIVPTYAKYSNT